MDSVTCQQGLQFFPDQVAALAEMRRIARPGARLAVSVWRTIDRMPVYGALVDAAEDVLGGAGGLREAAFGLADPMRLATLADAAGWTGVEVSPRDLPIEFPSVDAVVRAYEVTPVADEVRGLDADRRRALEDAVRRRLDPLIDRDGAVRTTTGDALPDRAPTGVAPQQGDTPPETLLRGQAGLDRVGDVAVRNWARNITFARANPAPPDAPSRSCSTSSPSAPRIRALGTGHSFNRIADTDGDLVTVADLDLPVAIDPDARTVRGRRRHPLRRARRRAATTQGWALPNLGSLPHISVAGACATGTHGSGVAQPLPGRGARRASSSSAPTASWCR